MNDNESPEELGQKINALHLWDAILPFNWIVKPLGTVFPYFCTILKGDGKPVCVRYLMIEGWQTFHDFVRTRVDRNWGFYSTPMELPHFELVVGVKILWETYGVMMRVESDRELPLRFATDKSMFARVETSAGWIDTPMEIPDPRPHIEKVSIAKALLAKAKDLPFGQSESVELDFRIDLGVVTKEPRPRCAYRLLAIDPATGACVISDRTSVTPDGGLKAMWEGLAPRVLTRLVERGRIPGEIRVCSGRVFRMLRPLCLDIPFKLSLHDALPKLEAAFAGGGK